MCNCLIILFFIKNMNFKCLDLETSSFCWENHKLHISYILSQLLCKPTCQLVCHNQKPFLDTFYNICSRSKHHKRSIKVNRLGKISLLEVKVIWPGGLLMTSAGDTVWPWTWGLHFSLVFSLTGGILCCNITQFTNRNHHHEEFMTSDQQSRAVSQWIIIQWT